MDDPAENCLAICADTEEISAGKEMLQTATARKPGQKPSELWEQLDQQNFAEDYRTMLQNTAEDVETMSLEQADEHLDVKQLQLVYKQLRLAESLQAKQEYFLPMYLGGQLAGVHLTLQQGAGETGAVEIRVDVGDNSWKRIYR